MPKSNNRGWLTGGNADFENYIGLCMKIPNNPYMIRAFWGAMLLLGESWNYQYEGGTEARDTANVWKAVTAENMLQSDLNEDCTMTLIDAYIDNCIIYFKQGGEYVPLIDISACVDGRIRDANSGGGGNDTTIWNDIYAPIDPAHPTDDLDCVWGGVKSLVNYLWTKLDEWLNIIEAAANASEAVAEIFEVDGVPVYAPLDLFLDFVNSVLDFSVVVVRASYNTDTLEDLMCELFCLVVENGNTLDTGVKESFLTANALSLNPTRAALGALAFTYSGATWRKYYLLGTNNCENDWSILCDECGEPEVWEHDFDFALGLHGWTILNELGHAGSLGIVHDNKKPSGCWYRGIRMFYEFADLTTITKVSLLYSGTHGDAACNPADGKHSEIRKYPSTTTIVNKYAMPNGASEHLYETTFETNGVTIFAHADSQGLASQLVGSVTLLSAHFEGSGVDPFAP